MNDFETTLNEMAGVKIEAPGANDSPKVRKHKLSLAIASLDIIIAHAQRAKALAREARGAL